ncbi:hypothetical protein A6557_004750 [Salmonella enterica subsp. enterica serovar Glostrup]|nr:hypothetical protein [Salmonella enterica subsp. enterica serovar Glostrup]
MNRKIAGMVRLLLPVFLLTGLSVNIQAVAAADTEVVPAGNSVVSRSNGAMTMSGLVQAGTCSVSASNTTMNFKPMTVKEIQDKGNGGLIGQFDTLLNLSNCNGDKWDLSINSADYMDSGSLYKAYLRYSGNGDVTGLYYSVNVDVKSGYCIDYGKYGESCSAHSGSAKLDGSRPSAGLIGDVSYEPDNDSYPVTLTTKLYYGNKYGTLPVAFYTGSYIWQVNYH